MWWCVLDLLHCVSHRLLPVCVSLCVCMCCSVCAHAHTRVNKILYLVLSGIACLLFSAYLVSGVGRVRVWC